MLTFDFIFGIIGKQMPNFTSEVIVSRYLKSKKILCHKAKIFKALSHPTRLYMVEELIKGEKCVCEFVDEIKADFSTISKHLSVLKEAEIIKSEKRKNWVYYHISMTCTSRCINSLEDSLKENAEITADLFNQK